MDLSIGAEELLALDLAGLRNIRSDEVVPGAVNADVVRHFLRLADALWTHSGDPQRPHAELTSGLCSDGFVDVLRLLRFTNVCRLLAQQMVRLMPEPYRETAVWVVGSDHASAAISHSVAEELGCQHDFTERDARGTHIWRRFEIGPEEPVLQVEEIVTTSKTLQAVRQAIRDASQEPVRFLPCVLTVVNRSGSHLFDGWPIICLLHLDIRIWPPDRCPLCAAGSKRLRPKANWRELTGQ